jgi:hypothetical protein
LQVVCAREFALRKRFFERAVVAKAWRYVSPLREQRVVRSATRNVSTHGHRTESAAVVTLPPRDNAEAIFLTGFEMKLTREFNRSFGRFRTT